MPTRPLPAWLRKLREDLRASFQAHVEPPAEHDRLRRVLYGAGLPFAVLRALLGDPVARARYLRIALGQLIAMLGVTGLLVAMGDLLPSGKSWSVLAVASALYGALCVAEAIVLALSNGFHDAVSLDAAERVGVPGEPLGAPPRVRVDFKWLRLKLLRHLRNAAILASGVPFFALATLLPGIGNPVAEGLEVAWTLHWLVVFALGNSPRAWEVPLDRDPWFLRGLDALGPVPLFGWPFRLYAKLWRRWVPEVSVVCRASEGAPYEAAGLAATRAVAGLPGLYLFLRPLFPVAATRILMVRVPGAVMRPEEGAVVSLQALPPEPRAQGERRAG